MKKALFSFGAVLLSVSAMAWAADEPAQKVTSATYMITGLHCPACTKTVEGSLSKSPGVRSIKVDWNAKDAKIEFDESVLSAQRVAELIAETPHMMGPSMHYNGWLALKAPDVNDDATAGKAKEALQKVPGVKMVAAYPDKHVVEIQFSSDGAATSKQLIGALAAAGIKAENF
jgi:copper chaperone CopZ